MTTLLRRAVVVGVTLLAALSASRDSQADAQSAAKGSVTGKRISASKESRKGTIFQDDRKKRIVFSENRLETIVNIMEVLVPLDSEGWGVLSMESNLGSVFRISGPPIDEIVKQDLKIVPYLVEIMEVPSLSDYRFALCATACDQILLKHDPKFRLGWVGGLMAHRVIIRSVGSDGTKERREFRARIIKNIKTAMKKLQNKKPAKSK